MSNEIPTTETISVRLPADEPAEVDIVKVTGSSNIVLTGLFVLAVFYTLYFARAVLLPIVLALLFALILAPAVRALARARLPQPIGAALVVALLVGALGVGAYSLIDPATAWIEKVPETMRKVETKLRGLRASVREVTKAADKVEELTNVDGKPAPRVQAVSPKPSLMSRILTGTQNLLVSAASTIILLYFLLASGDMFLRKLVRVLPTLSNKKQAVEIARTIQSDMARYLFTITCINFGLGVATAIAMYLIGIPNPILWGVMVAIFNYVPYIGAGASLTVLTTVAFVTFDDLNKILLVPTVFFSITVLEGQILSPILTGRRLTLNPVVIFISMLVWGWLWGVVGALMAVPILMTFKICCDHIESLSAIGEFLGGKAPDPEAP